MKRAVAYLRVSTPEQTTANQERVLWEIAGRMGCEIVKVYKDHGTSGAKDRDKRPGFDALYRDANRRQFDVVMAWSVDRLGRSLQERPCGLPVRAARASLDGQGCARLRSGSGWTHPQCRTSVALSGPTQAQGPAHRSIGLGLEPRVCGLPRHGKIAVREVSRMSAGRARNSRGPVAMHAQCSQPTPQTCTWCLERALCWELGKRFLVDTKD
jgi:hypothetical protein